MGWLDENFAPDISVAEASELTERELAVLLIPRSQSLNEEEQAIYDATAEKVRRILDLSVAERAGRVCSRPGCHAEALYSVTKEGEDERKSCQADLPYLIEGDCTVTTLLPAAGPEEESSNEGAIDA